MQESCFYAVARPHRRRTLHNAIFVIGCKWSDCCRLALQVRTPEWEDYLRQQKRERGFGGGNGLFNLLQLPDAHRDKLHV